MKDTIQDILAVLWGLISVLIVAAVLALIGYVVWWGIDMEKRKVEALETISAKCEPMKEPKIDTLQLRAIFQDTWDNTNEEDL